MSITPAEFAAKVYPEDTMSSHALRAVLTEAITKYEAEKTPEVTDAKILAALNATVKPESAAPDLSYWGEEAVSKMRASLEAANGEDS